MSTYSSLILIIIGLDHGRKRCGSKPLSKPMMTSNITSGTLQWQNHQNQPISINKIALMAPDAAVRYHQPLPALVEIMACWLAASIHYCIQYHFINIPSVLWQRQFRRNCPISIPENVKNIKLHISVVNELTPRLLFALGIDWVWMQHILSCCQTAGNRILDFIFDNQIYLTG